MYDDDVINFPRAYRALATSGIRRDPGAAPRVVPPVFRVHTVTSPPLHLLLGRSPGRATSRRRK